jgi:UrcA family protein
MIVRSTFFALAAVAAAILATGVAISPAVAQTDSVSVGYGDLNLASPAGRGALDRRIAGAARQVCGEYRPLELKMIALSRACRADVLAAARGQRSVSAAGRQFSALAVSRAAF